MNDTFQSWVERVAANREAKPLDAGEVVKSSAGEPFGAVEFVKVERPDFTAEVGKRGDQYIYHFYPSEKHLGALATFYYAMSQALVDVFKNPEQIEADWVEEMKSYAVRVRGWAQTVWGDELAIRAINVLDELLRTGAK